MKSIAFITYVRFHAINNHILRIPSLLRPFLACNKKLCVRQKLLVDLPDKPPLINQLLCPPINRVFVANEVRSAH